MIEPRTTTVEVRRSSGVRVNGGGLAWRGIGILHITQRYGVVKEFRRCDNRAMGLAEDAFERLRRIAFEGEHVERMAALGIRMKLSPGRDQDLDAPGPGGRRLDGRDGPRHRVRPVLHHGAGGRPGSRGAWPGASRRPTTGG